MVSPYLMSYRWSAFATLCAVHGGYPASLADPGPPPDDRGGVRHCWRRTTALWVVLWLVMLEAGVAGILEDLLLCKVP